MKNILYGDNMPPKNRLLKHIFRIMKIEIVFLFICCMGIYAENTHSQNMKVNIVSQNVPIGKVLQEIEEKTEYLFLYNKEEINLDRQTSVNAPDTKVSDLLVSLFDHTDITYAMVGNNIILMKNNQTISQQDKRQITGTVIDEYGDPIVGANVIEKGSTNGVITDIDGNFSLKVSTEAVLRISYIGYIMQEVSTNGKTTFSIQLKEDQLKLDEVIVVGYGTVRKSDLTGAVSSVSDKQFQDQNVTRLDQVLQGRAAGVQVTNTGGAPGGEVRIRIRGANSVLGDNSPLFVIDGFIGADFSTVNPNDIQSLEILKDASSTAIYGSRGANGVVLVTTKGGSKSGKVNISYQGDVSISNVIKKYDLLSAGEFATTVNERNAVLGYAPTFTQAEIDRYEKEGGFDYQDAVYRQALATQHQLSITGGTEKTQYRISANYLNNEGIVDNSDYERYTVRTNFITQYNDQLSFRFNVNGTVAAALNTQARSRQENPLVQALSWAPTTNPYDGEGGYIYSDPVGSLKSNPLSLLYDTENRNNRSTANLMGGVRYELIKGLSLDFQTGVDISYNTGKSFSGNYISNYNPSASVSNNNSTNIQTTTQLSYEKEFNNIHRINAVAVFETQKYTYESSSSSASKLKFVDLKYDNLAQAETYSVASGFSKWTLLSYLGRVNYSLLDRYLLSLSVRHDGSSKFAKGNKYSTFPSAAIAWNIKNESFMEEVDLLSKLKLRLSWGMTGSQAISSYATLSTYSSIYYAYTTGDRTSGIQLGDPGNPELTWETTEQKDLGFEAGFLEGRLNVEFDYFLKDTRDLLLNKSVPYYAGGGSVTSNVGKIRNQGWEASLSAVIVNARDVNWKSDFNYSRVKNTVKDLGDETSIFSNPRISGVNAQPEFIYEVGQPLGSFWGLTYLGPWQKEEAAEGAKYGQVPGDARYEDLNGDHIIDGSDYHIIGCGLPTSTLGWNNTISIKKFVVNVFFQGVFGLDKLNYTRAIHLMGRRDARQVTLAEIKNRYIPGVNEDAYLPAFSPTSIVEPQSTLFLEDGGYLRLKNLSVGYNFDIKKVGMLKLSLSATNLFTITDYKGIDPEASSVGGGGSDINQSVDFGAYPNSRTYTLGVNFTF